nr:ABC transporter permease [Chloroflexia bacterium]
MNVEAVLTALLASALIAAVPLTLAAVGEAIGERAGVLNLGLEGILLLAGFAAFWTALRSGQVILGLLAGLLLGAVVGAAFGWCVVRAQADQVVLGLALTLVGAGLSGFLYREAFGSEQPLLGETLGRPLAGTLEIVPVVGPAIFDQKWIVYVTWLIVGLAAALLHRTRFGREVRAVGEAPFAADAVGVSIVRVRLLAATLTGTLTGLGGAALAVAELGLFRPGMTVGLGFVAVAITMLG